MKIQPDKLVTIAHDLYPIQPVEGDALDRDDLLHSILMANRATYFLLLALLIQNGVDAQVLVIGNEHP